MKFALATKITLSIICLINIFPSAQTINSMVLRMTMQPNSYQDSMISKAINYTFIDSFPAAYACLDSVATYDPRYWPTYVFKAGVLYTEMDDDENYDRVGIFYDLIDSALSGLDDFLKDNPDDKYALFFKGTALGYRALYEGHHGSWLKAVTKGLAAGKQFSRAIEIDSNFYEAYLGLGSLNYWRSAKMGIFTALPFIPDKREEGIRQISLAMDSSRYSVLPAATGLAWIYLDRKDYSLAIRLMDRVRKDGIQGRQVLWPEGLAQFKRAYAPGIISIFSQIKKGLELKGGQNYYNIGLCNYYLGLAYFWQGEYIKSLNYLNALLNQKVDKHVAKRLKKHYKAAKEYKDKIKKAAAERIKNKTSR